MFPDTMVVRERPAERQDLLPCFVLDLREEGGGILEALGNESKVEVDACSSVVGLRDAAGDKWLSLDASDFACSRYPAFHSLAEDKDIAPWHRCLKRLSDEVISDPKVAKVGNHEGQEVSSEAILLPCIHPPVLGSDGGEFLMLLLNLLLGSFHQESRRAHLMRIEILPLGHVHLLGSIEPAGQGVRLPRLQRQAELKLLVVDQSD
mmetsp:Transcript_11309/g.25667  ORF Transcript_11309/g.25667 Transcript_11309/m.25667 type:complete len:206 (+) Transcript_11309:994-1611(+)